MGAAAVGSEPSEFSPPASPEPPGDGVPDRGASAEVVESGVESGDADCAAGLPGSSELPHE